MLCTCTTCNDKPGRPLNKAALCGMVSDGHSKKAFIHFKSFIYLYAPEHEEVI